MSELSKCCNAEVVTGGEDLTHWYICTACNMPCDCKCTDKEREA